jgi:hypothetical protein
VSKPSIEAPEVQFSRVFRYKEEEVRPPARDEGDAGGDEWATRRLTYLAESLDEVINGLHANFRCGVSEKVSL